MVIFKTLMNFILQIFFDHKEEYTFTSAKFNLKKVLILVVLISSISMNLFLFSNFVKVGTKYIGLKETCAATIEAKNKTQVSSDSQNLVPKPNK